MVRFDVVVGNPPYGDKTNKAKNNKLWHKFIEKNLSLCKNGGILCQVTPSSMLGPTGFGKKFHKLCSTIYNLIKIDHTANNHFKEGVEICSWYLTLEPYKGKTKVIVDDEEVIFDIREGLPLMGDKGIEYSILNKIANSNHPRIPLKIGQNIANHQYTKNGKYEIYSSGQKIRRTDVEPNTGDVLKFVVPFSCSYKNRFITRGYIGMLNVWCPIKNEEEGEKLFKIIDNPLIQFFIERYKKTAGYTAAVKNAEIPHIKDFNEVENQFNFTPEEIKYLRDKHVI